MGSMVAVHNTPSIDQGGASNRANGEGFFRLICFYFHSLTVYSDDIIRYKLGARRHRREATCMRLIHYIRPLLDLGSCKEYGMASKTTGNGVRRTRKAASVQPPVTPASLEAHGNGLSASMEEEIRRRAYEIYLQRGATPGREDEDWSVAEQEVRARQMQQSA
jgi:Protein of unknown function (DUF2934)